MEFFRFFNVASPENPTKEQVVYVDKFKAKIQQRVISCCLRWVERCPFDFYDAQMRKGLHDFVDFVSKNGSKEFEGKVALLKAELEKLKKQAGVITAANGFSLVFLLFFFFFFYGGNPLNLLAGFQ